MPLLPILTDGGVLMLPSGNVYSGSRNPTITAAERTRNVEKDYIVCFTQNLH